MDATAASGLVPEGSRVKQSAQRDGIAHGAAVLAVLLGSLASACQGSTDTTMLSLSDNGRTIVATVGDEIDVALRVVGPFYYGSPSVSSSSVRLVRQWEELPSQPIPGGPKTQRYLFEAMVVGRADVTIPREVPGAADPGFRIAVDVY